MHECLFPKGRHKNTQHMCGQIVAAVCCVFFAQAAKSCSVPVPDLSQGRSGLIGLKRALVNPHRSMVRDSRRRILLHCAVGRVESVGFGYMAVPPLQIGFQAIHVGFFVAQHGMALMADGF